MSLYEQKIIRLIHLLTYQFSLFTEEDKTSLATLINTVADDLETIANQIVLWYQERPNIKDAILNISPEASVSLSFRGQGIPLTPELAKEQINNALRLPTSEHKPDDSKQKPPKNNPKKIK